MATTKRKIILGQPWNTNMNPLLFFSSKYYAFKRDLVEYLISNWKNGMPIELNIIMDLDNIFLFAKRRVANRTLAKSLLKDHSQIQKGIYGGKNCKSKELIVQ